MRSALCSSMLLKTRHTALPPQSALHEKVMYSVLAAIPPKAVVHGRQEMLEGLIRRHLDANDIQPPSEGLQAEPAYQGSNLCLAMLDEGLLAGLGPKRRKQNLRRMQERDKKIQGLLLSQLKSMLALLLMQTSQTMLATSYSATH